jgi:hypothetical protein
MLIQGILSRFCPRNPRGQGVPSVIVEERDCSRTNPPFAAGRVLHSHETMEGLLCNGRHRFIPRQFPVFQSESSGKTASRRSKSKLSAVLSSNRMVMASASGSTSTLSTVLPLTWGNRRSLVRFLRGCVPLEVAIGRLSREGDLRLGARSCANTASPVCVYVSDFAGQCNEKEAKEEETNFVKCMVKDFEVENISTRSAASPTYPRATPSRCVAYGALLFLIRSPRPAGLG